MCKLKLVNLETVAFPIDRKLTESKSMGLIKTQDELFLKLAQI